MSRAVSLAKVLGADGTLNIADVGGLGALASLNTVGTSQIDNAAVTAGKLATNAVSTITYRSTGKVAKFSFGNASPNAQPLVASFTLSEAEAPLGSLVVMSTEVFSGNSAGDQYLYLDQRTSASGNTAMYSHVEGWYYLEARTGLFYINDAADRTFHVVHGTIEFSNNNDTRIVYYHGYIKVTQ